MWKTKIIHVFLPRLYFTFTSTLLSGLFHFLHIRWLIWVCPDKEECVCVFLYECVLSRVCWSKPIHHRRNFYLTRSSVQSSVVSLIFWQHSLTHSLTQCQDTGLFSGYVSLGSILSSSRYKCSPTAVHFIYWLK